KYSGRGSIGVKSSPLQSDFIHTVGKQQKPIHACYSKNTKYLNNLKFLLPVSRPPMTSEEEKKGTGPFPISQLPMTLEEEKNGAGQMQNKVEALISKCKAETWKKGKKKTADTITCYPEVHINP
ncbi:hypothetical protein NDU88_002267, partial [Pleurodeles waltl]